MVVGLGLLGAAAGLALAALRDTVVYYRTPSELIGPAAAVVDAPADGDRLRLGGMVAEDSVITLEDGTVTFAITDCVATMPVSFDGILPDLFREEQGVVVEGSMGPDGTFIADEVLAKHDETYMPPEVAESVPLEGDCAAFAS